MTHEHLITLNGTSAADERVSGHLLRDLLVILVDGSEQTLRYQIEGRSTARGTQPGWLRPASDFQIEPVHSRGQPLAFKVDAKPLAEAMPEKFAQATLFEGVDASKSPVDLFEDTLEEAIRGDEDSESFDAPLLETMKRFRALLVHGVESVEIKNGRLLHVDTKAVQNVARLADHEHPSRRVRIAGQLETIRHSDCRFVLILPNGARVAGTAVDLGTEALRGAFGKQVLIQGVADFRPSGNVLRINAEKVEEGTDADLKVFGTIPRPLSAPVPTTRAAGKGGFEAIFGQWPGDETDEQLFAQLRELS
jgi:hypothetical protein